ncbi:MAG: hypothetical protein JRJ39_10545 [Deltaproteobacteria bacterium]|nr:hypothetical protein [Deltaproteobacteria bacterium]
MENENKISLIVIVLMILVMVTILGLTATTVSRTELQISTNELISQRMFFTADSGIEHIRKQLQIPLAAANAGTTGGVNLTFALLGFTGSDPATATNYDGGAQWIDNADFDTALIRAVIPVIRILLCTRDLFPPGPGAVRPQ